MKCFTPFALFLLLVFSSGKVYAAKNGEMHYNYATKAYEFYNGTQWYKFDIALPVGGVCTKEGEMEYDHLLLTYKYCNGSNWKLIVGAPTLIFCSTPAKMDYFNSSYHFCNGILWINMKGLLAI